MPETIMKPGGIAVFWSAGESNRDRLSSELKFIDLAKFIPDLRTPFAVLKDAISEVYNDPKYIVRATGDDDSLAVIEEVKGVDGAKNTYTQLAAYHVKNDVVSDDGLWSRMNVRTVADEYIKRRNILHGTSVTTALVNIVEHLGGTPLRPHGGIYWLSDAKDERWQQVVKAFQLSGSNEVYTMRLKYDADMVRAVTAAISAEVHAEAERIDKEIKSGDLGERACRTRESRATELLEKLGTYESLLGISVDDVRKTLNDTKTAAAMAIMQVMAAESGAVAS